MQPRITRYKHAAHATSTQYIQLKSFVFDPYEKCTITDCLLSSKSTSTSISKSYLTSFLYLPLSQTVPTALTYLSTKAKECILRVNEQQANTNTNTITKQT